MEVLSSSLAPTLEDMVPRCKSFQNDDLTWDEMIQRLLEIFESNEVNIEEVEEVLDAYTSKAIDWKRFAKHDKFKYTRNLVHEGNGKFNLMLLCWSEGNQSSIHDHSNAHCFVKCLDGQLQETRYFWPHEASTEDGALKVKDETGIKQNNVTYMSDQLGLHRIENPSHTNIAVSLHLYSPPFNSCMVFDERTGSSFKAPMTFWSKYGEKVSRNSKKLTNLTSTGD